MGDFELLILSGAVTFAGILILLLSPSSVKSTVSVLLVIVNAVLTSVPAVHVLGGQPLNLIIYGSSFFGNIPIRIDGLSAWFILIINFTCINGVLYGAGYMKSYSSQKTSLTLHHMLFLLFHSAMLWVCMIQNSLAFLVAWELMSLASLLLIVFDHQNQNTIKAGINYLVQMHIGILFISTAFIWVYFSETSFDFAAIGNFFSSHPNTGLFLLFFIGFGLKAGFIPLHSWLPHAHPAAPSPVSGIMSGVMVKVGIYGILRIATFLKHDFTLIGESLLVLSVLTSLYGIINAAVHRDYKKMLAFCTIENIGIIGSGIGLGLMGIGKNQPVLITLGFGSALLHILNHSLFKSLLFFSAGTIYQQTHTRDMEKLGGLIKQIPHTAVLFLIGALAIGGLPPLNGFVSEFLLYSGFLEGIKISGTTHSALMIFSIAGIAVAGGISMLTFTKSFGTIFLGSPRTKLHHHIHEASYIMRLPQYIIVAVMISISLFPEYYFSFVSGVITSSFPAVIVQNSAYYSPFFSMMSGIGTYSLFFLGLLGIIFMIRTGVIKKRIAKINSTWGCGYVSPIASMQYTGKSFSKSLGKLLNFLVVEKKKYREISLKEIFPVPRNHSSHYLDFFETNIFHPVTDRLVYAANYFKFIQNGKIQMYVLYGIFFIVLIFFGTFFNLI